MKDVGEEAEKGVGWKVGETDIRLLLAIGRHRIASYLAVGVCYQALTLMT